MRYAQFEFAPTLPILHESIVTQRASQGYVIHRSLTACQKMVEDNIFEIGGRVECDGHLGSIRYIGPVGTTKGQWLGIDWDDPSRGKHDGTYEGKQYYKTWHSTSGSFIRPGKAKVYLSCPRAIKLRYGLVNDQLAGINAENLTSLQKSLNAPFLEMVGFSKVNRKQSQFEQLKIVCLRDQGVFEAGAPGELAGLCPSIEELDLSKNFLRSWKVVAEICSQLRALVRLNVSENDLPMEENMELLKDAFLSIHQLSIGLMKYNWLAIQKCLVGFTSIQELSVSFNIVKEIEEPVETSTLRNLTKLMLEGNEIFDWNEVLKLGCLVRLKSLNLNSNKIETIRIPTNCPTEKTSLFPALKQLHISENRIADWRSVSELEKLMSLEDLKFRENPIIKDESVETARQLVIARISNLKFLNGTEITASERRGAEYDYLKLFAKQWLESEQNVQNRHEFVCDHPRYPALVEKYGAPDIPVAKANTQMISNVITVEFVCPDDPSRSIVKRKLLKDMDVQKVTGLAQRLFKTGGQIPTLSFVRPNLSTDEIPLDKPLQELSYYVVQEGDRILVRW